MKAGPPPRPEAPAAPRRRRRRAFEAKAGQPWRPQIGAFPLRARWRLDQLALRRLPEGFRVSRKRSHLPKPTLASKRVQAGHPQVFRWQYYLDTYPELRTAGLRTRDQALRHWKTRGIREGRHAHPRFSPVDYLRLHADVRLAARRSGTPPLQAAITHWLQQGQAEGRQGRVVPPAPAPAPAPAPPPLTGLAARLTQILDGSAPSQGADEAPSYLNVELPDTLRRLLKKSD